MDDAHRAVHLLDQRGAALDPVAAVQVERVADLPDFRAVDMAADDTIDAAGGGEPDHGLFELGDVFHRRLGAELQIGRDRPVPESQPASNAVEKRVEGENPVVEPGSHLLKQAVESDEPVELVSMEDQVPPSVGAGVDAAFHEPDRTETHSGEVLEEFVVVAVDQGDPGVLAALAQDLLQEDVVFVPPIPTPLQLPAVDQVPDDVEVLRVMVLQEVEQGVDLG